MAHCETFVLTCESVGMWLSLQLNPCAFELSFASHKKQRFIMELPGAFHSLNKKLSKKMYVCDKEGNVYELSMESKSAESSLLPFVGGGLTISPKDSCYG